MLTPVARTEFDFDEGILWLMHCGEGPVPRRSTRALAELLEKELRPWSIDFREAFVDIPGRVRSAGGSILGARSEDISITATTSSGLVTTAQGMDWRAGDEVLLPLGEFPSNVWPWLALRKRGVIVREVPLWDGHRSGKHAWDSSPPPADLDPEARLLDAIGPRTRLLSTSWVRFQDGIRLDLTTLATGCRAAGVHLVVDGIQGAGTLPVPLKGVAAFATGGHKGLLAPQGLGLLWTDAGFREHLVPCGSWLSVDQAMDFSRPSTDFQREWASDGTRLEQGVPNLLGCAALAASLELLAEAGADAIARHVAGLQRRLLSRLSRVPAWAGESERLDALLASGRLGTILGLHHSGRGPEGLGKLIAAGSDQGIYASVREGYLRIAFHGWHDDSDVERAANWLLPG
jgi:selenocysteine lyase/cysteine desulfurase